MQRREWLYHCHTKDLVILKKRIMHLFISDVHLGAFNQEKEFQLQKDLSALIHWCRSQGVRLHVLGDLFDYWMETENYIPPLGNQILADFKSYHEKIGPTLYFTGNHDCWTLGHLADCGFRVHAEPAVVPVGKKKVLLFHGDGAEGLGPPFRRPLLHRVLRNPAFVELYSFLFTGEQANAIMKKFSAFTRDPHDRNPEKLDRWASMLLKELAADALIAGHDHVPRAETFYGKAYINCGAFYSDKTLARYKNGTFDLVIWNSESHRLEKINQTPRKRVIF